MNETELNQKDAAMIRIILNEAITDIRLRKPLELIIMEIFQKSFYAGFEAAKKQICTLGL